MRKLLCLCILVVVGGLAYLFVSFYDDARVTAMRELNDRQLLHAKQASQGITEFFEYYTGMMTYLAELESIRSFDETGQMAMETFYRLYAKTIRAVSRLDARGRIIYSYPPTPPAIGADVSHFIHIQEVLRTHQTVISDVFSAVQGFDCIALHVPVFQNGAFDGTIAALINFEEIAKRYLQQIKIGETGYAWMISRDGTELYCPVPGHTGHTVFENCKDFPSILAMAKEMLQGKEGTTTYDFNRIAGEKVETLTKLAVYRPIKVGNTFWSIVVASSEDEMIASLRSFRNRLLLLIGMLLLAGSIFSYYGVRAWLVIREEEKRRRAEDALKESRQQLADIIDFLPDATLVIDKEGKVIAWNRAIEEMTGIKAAEMLGKGDCAYALPFYGERKPILVDFALHPDEEREKGYPTIRRSEGTVFAETLTTHLPSGIAYLSGNAAVLRDINGEISGAIECIRDDTERMRAQREVQTLLQRFHTILSHLFVGVLVMTESDRVEFANQTFCDLLGVTEPPSSLIGFSAEQILERILPAFDDPTERLARIREIVAKRHRVEGEEVLMRGGRVLLRDFIPILINGEQTGRLWQHRDITERKRAAEERRRLEERFQRAEKMEALGTLAGGVAHDLNNVLGIIVGFSELLLDEVDPSHPASPHVREVFKGGERAAAIVQDLLTLTRRGVPSRKVLNLNNVVMEYRDSPEFTKASSRHPNIEMKSDLEPDLLNIAGSSVHIGKSFLNLVVNAVEAMPEGGLITIKTRNQYVDKPFSGYDEVREGDYAVLSVTDTGEGIPAADLKRIFEPFYTKKIMGRSGTGLGLAVVWGTVKDHHGYIDVESEEGKGTTFTLYFPVTREALSIEEAAVAVSEYLGNGETILVVDDVKEQRDLATVMLNKLNYKVMSAAGGEAAVEYLKQHAVDLIVLDMIMEPGMDGLATYAKVLETHPGQKAIIVSGFAETDRVYQAQAMGAGDYVKKPYVLEKLGLAVKKALVMKTSQP
jgi:two-component system, cell cycle sensor histidine kinase and response regulator CckA